MKNEIFKKTFSDIYRMSANRFMSHSTHRSYFGMTSLTKGAVANYQNGNIESPAIVKIVNIRACELSTIASASASAVEERYRLMITDGEETFNACILSPNLNSMVKENRLVDGTIVQLERVVHNLTSTGKPFLSILDLTILPSAATTAKPPTANICPIAMVTPYLNGIWKIRARCFAKSAIRPHPVCDFDLVDNSGEIRLVAFGNECATFHSMIEVNKIYEISGVRVKTADSRWNNLHHQYSLTLTSHSVVRPIDDPNVDATIPDAHFNFIPLRDVPKRTKESFIDVIGVVENCTDVIPFVNRTSNRDSKRRELTIVDEDTSISVTLWDEQAADFDEECVERKDVIAFQRIRVAIYNNKYSLSSHRNMLMKINPDIPEAKHLRIWYDAGGGQSTQSITTTSARPAVESSWITIGNIEIDQLGRKGRPDYVTIKALCMHIADNRVVYPSCNNGDCRRKVVKLSSGLYRCDKCERETNECRWSYMLRAELVDSTGAIWVSFFGQQAQELMGDITADQFAQAKENDDEALMQNYLNANCFRERIFRLRINEETFNDMTMVKVTCLNVSEIDFNDYGRRLMSNITNQF